MVTYEKNMSLDGDASKSIPVFHKDENACLEGHSPFEILLGKDKLIFNHAGNKRFRAIINHNVHKYINAATKSTKSKVVRVIHADMLKAGFRFRKKDQFGWSDIKEIDGREKLSHALRDRVREMRRSSQRQQDSAEGVYPLIISMAQVLHENQKLLDKCIEPLPTKNEWSRANIPTSTKMPLSEKHSFTNLNKISSPNNLLDIIGSIPTNTGREDFMSGQKRKVIARTISTSSFVQEESPFKRRRGMETSCFDRDAFEGAHDVQLEESTEQNEGYVQENEVIYDDSMEPVPIYDEIVALSLQDFQSRKRNECQTIMPSSSPHTVTNEHEGYGIAEEQLLVSAIDVIDDNCFSAFGSNHNNMNSSFYYCADEAVY
mmetsp:Transcript_11106/g.17035  ORF Transcript_11106/g.17035 Transcript_11106/m.17035 type:complete len:374 (-) Transcript_11106:249-1370(-)|eukprot:CAMPEP_0194218052 /NCGR_PEP_ID=MMETSP0156-20130528/22864_1 /TAXON_ID=33649 /ORGANISM="Thalassionema nitzschioides, Strain L26-B" /LENGTH=373 /DNA_ID=CAMNT_0038947279 /DNA_START=109 /DNA_END=1230 /DNA_ORIENTATION=+